ncbi:MAG: hypothetical protein ACREU4_05440, partial [Burkholderiales bacterium]
TYILVVLISPYFDTQPWRLLSVLVLILPYHILSTVGVWRSANAYPLTQSWPVMAKIVVCAWVARMLWSLSGGAMRAVAEMNT